ncbi:hypothetical protein N5P37_011792 [Trichoderma harzianum]|uniref:Uncharacterized protein n=1 Tax=Trichoderma harzianum CBS 226.95 TaxID=983964 RepID=A0A2T3ZRE6_TRIHA|nr:hypothetical protein M431DRAFT_488612 [Trichoderma harzianum CBS 226.95]KAK0755657.1 hypothetical protein N5P37_011792 [Trichoderma harzianum]PKK41726.1 hypothetical protein CI102_14880 [Trichoderma harzianum]PTB47379.1 hypothetical protein M431DRAFT_488612 [Trichoderma harzianum CBS 226.95]
MMLLKSLRAVSSLLPLISTVRGDTYYKCTAGGAANYPDYDSWGDCQKAWNMLVLQQTGCDGVAWLPDTYRSTQYGYCVAQMRSKKAGGSGIDSTLVGASFNMLAVQCAGLGEWVYSDNSGIAQVYIVNRQVDRRFGLINGTEAPLLDTDVAVRASAVNRRDCDNGTTLFSRLRCVLHQIKLTFERKIRLTRNPNRQTALAAMVVDDMRRNRGNTIHLAQTIHGEGGDATFAAVLDSGTWGNLLATAGEDNILEAVRVSLATLDNQPGAAVISGNLDGGSTARFIAAANDDIFALAA